MTPENFERWVQTTKTAGGALDRTVYAQLEKPSAREPVRRFGGVESDLYHAIVNRCLKPGEVCMDQMMATGADHKAAHHHE